MSTRRLLNILRWIFLGLTLACFATRMVWVKRPEWVDRVDGWIVGTAHDGVRTLLAEAQQDLRDERFDEGLGKLHSFERRTRSTRRGDRRWSNRIHGLMLLAREYARRGELEEALGWRDALHELDDRYVPNEVDRADLLRRLGRLEEAIEALERLQRVQAAPTQVPAALFSAYAATGRAEEALRLLDATGPAGPLGLPTQGWEVRTRSEGASFGPATRVDLSTPALGSAEVSLRAVVEGDGPATTDVRIDAPRGARFELRSPTVRVTATDGSVVELDASALVAAQNIDVEGELWRAIGASDPFLLFRADEPIAAAAIEFLGDLRPSVEPDLLDFLQSGEVRAARDALEGVLAPWLVVRLDELQRATPPEGAGGVR